MALLLMVIITSLGICNCRTVKYVPSPHGTRCRFHTRILNTRSIPRSGISMYRLIRRLFSRSSLSAYFSPDHRIKIIASVTTGAVSSYSTLQFCRRFLIGDLFVGVSRCYSTVTTGAVSSSSLSSRFLEFVLSWRSL